MKLCAFFFRYQSKWKILICPYSSGEPYIPNTFLTINEARERPIHRWEMTPIIIQNKRKRDERVERNASEPANRAEVENCKWIGERRRREMSASWEFALIWCCCLLLFSWKGPRSVYSSSRTSLEHIQFKFDVDNRKLTRDKIFAFHHTPTKARVEGAETQTNN